MKQIAIVCFEDSHAGSIGAVCDAFHLVTEYVQRRSKLSEPVAQTARVTLLSAGAPRLRLSNGMVLADLGVIGGATRYDAVFLPGFGAERPATLAPITAVAGKLEGWLLEHRAHGALIAASGAAVGVLCQAGLLHRGEAAAPWWLEKLLRAHFPGVTLNLEAPVVRSGGVLTANGLEADYALALQLVSEVLSSRVAAWLAKFAGADGSDSALRTQPGEAIAPHHDPLVSRATFWLEERLSQPVRIRDLAEELAVSERTLARRFEKALGRTPSGYLQHLRVEISKQMLVRTDRSVARIAHLIGYSDTRFFRTLFRSQTGLTPSEFRNASRSDPRFRSALDPPSRLASGRRG